jgi:hypothetical protein
MMPTLLIAAPESDCAAPAAAGAAAFSATSPWPTCARASRPRGAEGRR